VSVALDELLTNTIAYGFAGRDRGEITVEAELSADRLSVTISDDGVPFDPFGASVPAPDTALPIDQRRAGGLGIHLVRRMLDGVSYQRRGDRNVVTLAKLLSGATDGTAEEGP
jgi:serine/threonine-protein kinase RsbW